jgi:hypothetical protein
MSRSTVDDFADSCRTLQFSEGGFGHILSMSGRGLAPVLHSDDAEIINAVKVGLQLLMSSQGRFTVIHVKVGRL